MLRCSARWLTVCLATLALVASAGRDTSRASNETVLLVTAATPSAGDLAIQARLQNRLGLTVVTESGSATAGSHASGKALVLISSSAVASEVGIKFQGVTTPVLTWNAGVLPNLNMTGPGTPPPNNDFGTAAHFSEVVMATPVHAMAGALSGTVTVATAPGNFTWGWSAAPSAIKVATLGVGTNRLAIFGYEEGKPMVTGTAPKRRVGLFLTNDTATQFIVDGSGNGPGWTLFEAAVSWAMKVNIPPSIDNVAASYTVSHPTDTLALVALVDDDDQPEPPGLIYQWTQGPTNAFCPAVLPLTLQSPTENGTYVSFSQAGHYCIRFATSDGLATSTKDVEVTVNLEDRPPVVSPVTAQPSASVVLGSSITLSATASDEGLAAPLKYAWTKLSGPTSGIVTFGSPAAPSTTATFSAKGVYELRLQVWDGTLAIPSGNIVETTIVVTSRASALLVVNSAVQPPTDASMSAGDRALRDRLEALGFATTPLRDASASSTGSQALGKQVVVISGSVVDGNVLVKFKGRLEPVVVLRPTLFDNMALTGLTLNTHFGTTASQTQVAIALPADQRAAGQSGNVTVATPPQVITVGWGKPEGAGVKVATLTADTAKATIFGYASGAMMAQSFTAPGRRVGFFAPDAAILALSPAAWRLFDAAIAWASTNNLAPIATAGADATYDGAGLPLNSVPLNGSVIDDNYPPPPPGLSATWSLVSGPPLPPPLQPTIQSPSSATTTVALKSSGIYVFRLEAYDGDLKGIDEAMITVITPNQPPNVSAGNDQPAAIPTSGSPAIANLTGSFSDDGLPNPPATVSVAWSQVEGPAPAAIGSANSLATSVTLTMNGTYVFKLTASDGSATAADEVTVNVTTPALLVVGPLSGGDVTLPGDVVIKSRMTALGYAVTVKDGTVVANDATGKAVVVISPSADPVAVSNKLRTKDVSAVVARHDLWDDMAMTASNAFGTVVAQTKMDVVTAANAAAAGLTGTPSIASPSTFAWGTPGANAVKITSIAGDPAKPTIFSYDSNKAMVGGVTLPTARRVGFFLRGEGATVLNSNGKALLDAAISWAAKANQRPGVNAGLDRALHWPAGALQVTTTLCASAGDLCAVNDDGLPNPPGAPTTTWSQVSGPGSVTFATPGAVTTSATFTLPGSYRLRLTARDGSTPTNGLSAFDDVDVSVSATSNQNPTVEAGPDATVVLPTSADLGGWAFDDGQPGPLTTSWTRVSGPGTVVFGNPASAVTTARFDAPGVYRLRLTAHDSALAAADDVYVTAVANALVVTQSSTLTPDENAIIGRLQSVSSFDGIATIAAPAADASSADGKSLVVISPSVTASDVTTKFRAAAVPVITVPSALYDDMGMTGTGSGQFGSTASQTQTAISAGGHPLTAGLATVLPGVTVTSAATYSWGQPALVTGMTKAATRVSNPLHATIFGYEKGAVMPGLSAPARRVGFGLPPATLNSDGQLLFEAAVRWATSTNGAPRVSAGPDQQVTLPASATLDGFAFDDGLPSGLMTTWSAVAGPAGVSFDSASSVDTIAHFVVPGDYVLRLTAFDGLLSRWDQVSITVNPAPPNAPPTANAGPDLTVGLPRAAGVHGPLAMRGVVSDDSPTVSTSWTQIAPVPGPSSPVTNCTPTNNPLTACTFSAPGTYTLRLTATDLGSPPLSAFDEVTITVLPKRSALLVVPNATVNPLSAGDAALKARLTALGYSVSVAADNAELTGLADDLVTPDLPPAPPKNLVVVSNVDPLLVTDKLRGVAVPVIVTKASLYPAMAMADSDVPGVEFGEVASQTQVTINNEGHPLAAQLMGTTTLTTGPVTFGFASKLIDDWKAAWQPGYDRGMVFGYEQGTIMLAALKAPARRVGFPTAAADLFTPDGWRMFETAVEWATERVVPALYITGSSGYDEKETRRRLGALGFAIVTKSHSGVSAADALGKALIVISRSASATILNTQLQGVNVPVVTFDPENFYSMGMTGGVAADDYGTTPNQTALTILQPTHPLAARLSGTQVEVLSAANGDFGWAMPGPSAAKVAVVVGYSYGATIFGYEKGAVMPGLVAPARRVGLYMNENSVIEFTANGWAILDAALLWSGDADPDADGLSTFKEYKLGTDPYSADTNGDGIVDGAQADGSGGATNLDVDGDGLSNAVELQKGTDPFNRDTDGDGSPDGTDCFPLDSNRSTCPAGSSSDHTPPTITLTEPTGSWIEPVP